MLKCMNGLCSDLYVLWSSQCSEMQQRKIQDILRMYANTYACNIDKNNSKWAKSSFKSSQNNCDRVLYLLSKILFNLSECMHKSYWNENERKTVYVWVFACAGVNACSSWQFFHVVKSRLLGVEASSSGNPDLCKQLLRCWLRWDVETLIAKCIASNSRLLVLQLTRVRLRFFEKKDGCFQNPPKRCWDAAPFPISVAFADSDIALGIG